MRERSHGLHSLYAKIWRSGQVPADWRDGVIILLYKGKGSNADCSSYRPISLLSVPGKVFGLVLLSRLRPLLTAKRRPEQSSFTASRSTVDAILALLLLSEIPYKFQRPLHVAYVDLKLAFDSVEFECEPQCWPVDRSALWLALKGVGTPDILLQLLKELHTGSGARVMVGANVSDRFCTTSGVRQCCVLAPALFCHAIDWILDNMTCLKRRRGE